MNLGELRLKALQSLKRPYTSPLPSPTEGLTVENHKNEQKTTVVAETTAQVSKNDREEGEITDESEKEETSLSDSSEESETFHALNFPFKKRNRYNTARTTNNNNNYKKSKYIWTRNDAISDDDFHLESSKDLNSLINSRTNALKELDETISLIAAYEDRELDLKIQRIECRDLRRKSEQDRFRLEKRLEKLDRLIKKTEFVEDNVSSTNFKKIFVGKMFKESYLRSLSDFISMPVYKIYSEILDLEPNFNRFRGIDPMIPCCLIELSEGKCPFKNDSCTLQHLL